MVALIKGSTAASPCTPTVSIGVYATGLDDLTYDAVIDKADKALYEAKHRGKNRICVYGAVSQRRRWPRPSSVSSGSTCVMVAESSATHVARPPVATTGAS